ncbi:MAG: prolyl oligopeptidase family serine peptidase [Vicingaceae bacterium]|nr:prolyl oligopeptidase family serine peptidase [Vicingaceae bacterium]
MYKIIIFSTLAMLINLVVVAQQKITYPKTQTEEVNDAYFGKTIQDPYRWLEDDNSEETKNWVEQQNKVTKLYLDTIQDRKYIHKQLSEMWNYSKMSIPQQHGEQIIFTKNDGNQNFDVYYIKNSEDGENIELLNPNTMSKDGSVSINFISVSKDNKYMAYAVSSAGSDWIEINVMELATKKILSDHIKWVKFSGIAWYKNGFYYSGYKAPETGGEFAAKNEHHTVFYHKLETNQSEDEHVFWSDEFPLRNFRASVTEDEQFLIVSASEGTSGNMLFVKNLESDKPEFITLVDDFESDTYVVGNNNENLIILTNIKAPNKKIMQTTIDAPNYDNWAPFISENEDVIEGVSVAGDKVFVNYLKDVQSRIEVFTLDGGFVQELKLPNNGIASTVVGKLNQSEAYITFSSYIQPTSIYKFNVDELVLDNYFVPSVDFKTEEYETNQVFFTSKDGTKIPMFISHKKGLKLDGTNPCLLYGYGGFNISIKPGFDVSKAVFMQNGGIYAVANLRGGSEYGEKWHKAGMLENKQNVFDDFIAAANYLKQKKYTSTEKLAIHGRSNGGLLIGAVMTQQPNLAKVALPMVGVLDMLRYHKFTIGWAWSVEYGSSENENDFKNLLKYSPLHNLKKTNYPATLIITADHDDRVVPAHSFKFAATLQKMNTSSNPTLIRIDTKSGHGSGKSKQKLIDEWTDIWTFTFHNLGMKAVVK